MARDTAEVLEDIARVQRQYVDHMMDVMKRNEERMARIERPKLPEPRDFKEIERRSEERAAERRKEERAFQERLLQTLERQNDLLARLLSKSTRTRVVPHVKRTRKKKA